MGIKKVKRAIGARVKDERRRRGLKQEELAEISGVSTKTIIQIENFKGNPTIKTIDKLAKTFKMKLEELLCDSE